MKAISLWQPWASLIALGLKKVETRSWGTSHRGPILIHAAKRWTREERDYLDCLLALSRSCKPGSRSDLRLVSYHLDKLHKPPLGAVVAIAELADVAEMDVCWLKTLTDLEREVGGHAIGRFAWNLRHVMPLDPIPLRGHQGIFNVSDEILPRCAGCDRPSACWGNYDAPERQPCFACASCCGHRQQGGWCAKFDAAATASRGGFGW